MNEPPTTREEMLKFLLESDIRDSRVMGAMATVPREEFVPPGVRHLAYGQNALAIGHGQTISTPFIVASMTELLELQNSEKLLEIGTGCGYQTAVLCEIIKEVWSMEIVPEVAAMGAANLTRMGYFPKLKVGDGSDGWASQAPFDRVLLTATSPRIPPVLLKQLKVGGMALGPEREDLERGHGRSEVLARYVRTEQGFERSVIYGVRFVPMTGKVRDRAPDI